MLYLSGFDPRGAGHYHALYRQEAEKAQGVTQRQYTVSGRKRNGRFSASWNVTTDTTTVDYEFLSWDDIVRQNWPMNPLHVIAKSMLPYWYLITTGTLRRIYQTSKIHFITSTYPLLFLAFLFIVSAASMLGVVKLMSLLLPGMYSELLLTPVVGYVVFDQLGKYLEARFNYYWVVRIVSFIVTLCKGRVEGFEQRIDEYAEHLLTQCRDESYDEVLLIGHSVGSTLLPMVLDKAISIDPELGGGRERLAIVTLGHLVPDLTLLPCAERFREAVCRCVSQSLMWLDVTAPPDGACYPLVDIAAGSCDSTTLKRSPYHAAISARFHKMFKADYYHSIKFDKNRIHFQYLMSGDYETEYNYFNITAGPTMLKTRYAAYLKEKTS